MGAGRLSRFLSSLLGQEIKIGRLQSNFWNLVVFKDVFIDGPVTIACPEIEVHFSWLNFLLVGQNPNLGLARIEMKRPVVVVKPLRSPHRRRALAPFALAPFWITWEEADLSVTDPGKPWDGAHLDPLNGWLEISPTHLEIQSELDSSTHGRLLFDGQIQTGRGRRWTASLDGRGADLEFFERKIPPNLKGRIPESLTGHFSGQIKAEGSLTPHARLTFWQASGALREAGWRPSPGSQAIPFNIRFEADPSHLKIPQSTVMGTLQIKGDIKRPWYRNREVDLSVNGKNVDLAQLHSALPANSLWYHIPAKGWADLEANMTGPPGHPSLRGNFSLREVSLSMTRFPELKGWVELDESSFNVRLNTFGGQVSASGTLENGQANLTVNGNNLDLLTWARANGWRNIGGIAKASLRATGPLNNLSAQGTLQIDRFSWGSRREKNPVIARLTYQSHQLVLQSQGDTLYLEAGLEGDRLALRRFHIISSQDLWVKGEGSISGPEKSLDLQIEARGLPVGDWLFLSKQYPLATGHLSFRGLAKGTLKNPDLRGDFSIDDLSFRPGSKTWRLKGVLAYTGSSLELKDAAVNPAEGATSADQYHLTLRWTPVQRAVDGELELAKADPSFLQEAAGLSSPLVGTVSGKAKLSWKDGRWRSMSMEARWEKGRVGPLAFEEATAHLSGDERSGFSLEKLDVQQSSGAFSVQGDLAQSPENLWTLQGRFRHTQIGSVTVDGEIGGQGTFRWQDASIVAALSSPSLFLNDYSLGSMQAHLAGDKNHVKISNFVSVQGIEGALEISFSSHELNGHLMVHDQDLKTVLHRIIPESQNNREERWPSGRIQGDVKLAGTLEAPRLFSTLSITDGSWRQVPFQMDIELAYAHKLLMIEPVHLEFPSEGEARVEGFLDFESPEPIHLYGEIASLTVPEAVQLLGLPPIWNGRVQATADMEGTFHEPRVSVAVTGEHDKWGPIPAGPLEARLRYDGKAWNILEALIGTPDGHIGLDPESFVYADSPGQGRMRLVTEVRNIHLGPVTFFGGLEVAGQWKVTEGRPYPVSWDLDAVAHGLWVNQQRLDGQLARCRLENRILTLIPMPGGAQTLSGTASFVHLPVVEIRNLVLNQADQTRVELNGEFSAHEFNYSLACQKIAAETLASLFDLPFPITGVVDLVMTASGPILTPFWQGSFLCAQGRIYNVPFDTFRADFSRYNNTFAVKNFRAVRGKGYLIHGEGKFPVGNETPGSPLPSPSFNVVLEDGDLAIMKDVWAACRDAHGQFEAAAEMKKVGDQSVLEGHLKLKDARVQSTRYFSRLTEGNAVLLLHNNRLEIEELQAKLGPGRLVGGGWVEFEGLSPSEYHVFVKTPDEQGISINSPQLAILPGPVLKKFSLFQKALATPSQGQPRLDLALKGSGQEPMVDGTVSLNNTTFTYPPTSKDPEGLPQWFRDFLNAVTWDITFLAGDKTRYQNELVDANLSGSLRFQGRLNEPTVNGTVTADRGAFVYAGEEFQINHAGFDVLTSTSVLTGATSVTPFLEAEAEKDIFVPGSIGADTVVMTIPRAPLGEIQPRFQLKSNPSLSSQKAMELALGLPVMTPELQSEQTALASQQSLTNQSAIQDQYLRAAVVQLFDASLASPIARVLATRSGLVDYIRVYYQPNNTQSSVLTPQQQGQTSQNYLSGSGLKIGKELGHRLFANYQFRVDEFENRSDLRHEFELAYRIKNNLFLTASTEVVGSGTGTGQLPPDRKAFLENQWRFSPPDMQELPEKNPRKGLRHKVKTPKP